MWFPNDLAVYRRPKWGKTHTLNIESLDVANTFANTFLMLKICLCHFANGAPFESLGIVVETTNFKRGQLLWILLQLALFPFASIQWLKHSYCCTPNWTFRLFPCFQMGSSFSTICFAYSLLFKKGNLRQGSVCWSNTFNLF